LGNVVRIVLDEEEERAWDLSFFPHLLLPDLVETHMARLGLQPAAKKQDEIPIRHRFLEMPKLPTSSHLLDCLTQRRGAYTRSSKSDNERNNDEDKNVVEKLAVQRVEGICAAIANS